MGQRSEHQRRRRPGFLSLNTLPKRSTDAIATCGEGIPSANSAMPRPPAIPKIHNV